MNSLIGHLWKFALITFTGTAGSITFGLMLHGSDVFNYTGINFAFVAFGLSGAFIFSFYHVYGLSNSITAALATSIVQFIIASVWMPMLNAGIWSFGVNLPVVWLAFLFERKLAVFHWAKFIVVGIVYGAMFVLLTLIVGVIQVSSDIPSLVFRDNFVDGLLIGLGMGLGVQAGEANVHSILSGK
ncbi:MAG: hypothetical protein WCX28_09655 [Bacteriovoracaceae bacterium]|nr:hypothetical protein [Bacteroidota bacterium]